MSVEEGSRYDFKRSKEFKREEVVRPPVTLEKNTITGEVNGVPVTAKIVPIGYSYTKTDTIYPKEKSSKPGDFPSGPEFKKQETASPAKFFSSDGKPFHQEGLIIHDFDSYAEFWKRIASRINPWVLKANLYPRPYVLQNYPHQVEDETICNIKPFDDIRYISRLEYIPYAYLTEGFNDMIERFSLQTGLVDRLSGLKLMLAASSPFKNGISDLAESISSSLPLVDTVRLYEQKRDAAKKNMRPGASYIDEYLQDIVVKVHQLIPVPWGISASASLGQLPSDVLEQVEQTRVKLVSVKESSYILDAMPVAAFVLPNNISGNMANEKIITPAVQQCYDKLGRMADFGNKDEFRTVIDAALNEFTSHAYDDSEGDPEFAKGFALFRKAVLQGCRDLLL